MHIKVRHGLDIPIRGSSSDQIETLKTLSSVAIDLQPLTSKNGLRPLVKEGDYVLRGQPIFEDKSNPLRKIVSPVAGSIKSILRGAKRVLEDIVITCGPVDSAQEYPKIHPGQLSREQLLEQLLVRGLFSHIRQRPFNIVADVKKTPRSIFVKALESAPFVPQPDLQIREHAEEFQAGLNFLTQLTDGPVHLVHRLNSIKAISQAQAVTHHTVEGPHPSANHSVHIHHIDPIGSANDVIWTLSAWDVLVIGATLTTGYYFNERIIAVAGEGILEDRRTLIKTIAGAQIADLLQNRVHSTNYGRIISGDPLMGRQKGMEQHLDLSHNCICVIPESESREFLHFFRPGISKYTASGTYLSSFIPSDFSFTTSLHGEERAFIDGSVYERVMPMRIPTMHLVKAAICEDYEQAERLGLLEIDAEDFALPCFVCPSKIEMVDIMKQAIARWSHEML